MQKLIRILQELDPPFAPKLWKAGLWGVVALALLVPAAVFLGLRVPQIEFLNGMAWQPKARPQSVSPVDGQGQPLFADGLTLRAPLPGTAPRGHQGYPWRAAVYGADELARIRPELIFNRSFDEKTGFRTMQVLAAPIEFQGDLMGALLLINRSDGQPYSEEDVERAKLLAETLGIAFSNQVRSGARRTKFDALVEAKILLEDASARGDRLSFASGVVRDVLYHDLPRRRRARRFK